MVLSLQGISTSRRRHLAKIVGGLWVAILVTVACYWPSLDGPFFFDDTPNLELLGERGGLTSSDRTIEFIMSGLSGPLGRPVSLASFTLDGQTWPTDPRPFRITNLFIHLVNGLLVFLLARVVFSTRHNRESAELLALLCACVWMLHPLLVSTTAYIVQRMTLLSSLFTLSGLLCYVHGRSQLPIRPLRGWIWILAAMGVCGSLAVFSKESGVLLPFYALVIEYTVFSRIDLAHRHKTALRTLLWLPLLAVVAFMAYGWDEMLAAFDFRAFSMHERLLTQATVLLDYLRQIAVPQLSGLGVIHDDYPISRGLFDPASTIVSVMVVAALIAFAVWARKKQPVISFGILWFFVGHSLEAGPFALELYFEHRNYLPMLGPVIAGCSLLPLSNPRVLRLLSLPLAFFVVVEGFLTWQAATTWSSTERLMQTTLAEHPNSLRAQQYVANNYIMNGQYVEALGAQEKLSQTFPQHASIRMSILNLRCILDELTVDQLGATLRFLEHSRYDRKVVAYLAPLTANAEAGSCNGFGFTELDAVFDALLRAPKMASNDLIRGAVLYHKGIAYQTSGDLDKALVALDLSYEANPDIDVLMNQIVWLLSAGRLDRAERYLRQARQHATGRFWRRNHREADLDALQQIIDKTPEPTPAP